MDTEVDETKQRMSFAARMWETGGVYIYGGNLAGGWQCRNTRLGIGNNRASVRGGGLGCRGCVEVGGWNGNGDGDGDGDGDAIIGMVLLAPRLHCTGFQVEQLQQGDWFWTLGHFAIYCLC